jgi:hypothetical protein
MANFHTITFDYDLRLARRVSHDLRAALNGRKRVKALGPGYVQLTPALIERLVERLLYVTMHAAPPIPDKVRRRGRPANNARIVLVNDLRNIFAYFGLSTALRYVPTESLLVEFYVILAHHIWRAQQGHNPRSTFARWKRAGIK